MLTLWRHGAIVEMRNGNIARKDEIKMEQKSRTFADWKEYSEVAYKIGKSLRLRPLGATVSLICSDTGLSVVKVSEALARMLNDKYSAAVTCNGKGIWSLV